MFLNLSENLPIWFNKNILMETGREARGIQSLACLFSDTGCVSIMMDDGFTEVDKISWNFARTAIGLPPHQMGGNPLENQIGQI